MMLNKVVATCAQALADVRDGAVVLIGGFGEGGMPFTLVNALIEQGAKDLTVVSNNAGNAEIGIAALLKAGRVRQSGVLVSAASRFLHFRRVDRAGKVELELVPQGTLAERMRAAGAGIGGFFTPTAGGTDLAKGKETRMIDGTLQVLEAPIHGDLALIAAQCGDRWGNLTYNKTSRNFGPIMASAAKYTVAQVRRIVSLGALDPEAVVTPGIFVHAVVQVDDDSRQVQPR